MKTKSRQGNVGQMKERVLFQRYTLTSDGMGGNTQTWGDVDTVWCNVRAVSGREAYEIGGLKGKVKYKILTRYRDDLDPAETWTASTDDFDASEFVWDEGNTTLDTYNFLMRAIYNGRTFNIEYAQDRGEDKTYVELIAVEDVNA
tara:strand:- start:585 stop:1019 length:435 start_codon:yes stop_codon:yes gene_type:complete